MGTSLYEDDSTRCFAHCFETTWDGPITHADQEVVWGEWVTLTRLNELLRRPGFGFVPDTRQLLARLAAQGAGDYADLLHHSNVHSPEAMPDSAPSCRTPV